MFTTTTQGPRLEAILFNVLPKPAIGTLFLLPAMGFSSIAIWLFVSETFQPVQPVVLGAVGGASLSLLILGLVELIMSKPSDANVPATAAEITRVQPLPKDDPLWLVYDMYRRRIVEEDRLINERTQWMIFSEAMFFAGCWVVVKADALVISKLLIFGLLAGLGIWIAILSSVSATAARTQIDKLVERYEKSFGLTDNKALLPLKGLASTHSQGHILPIWLPRTMVFLWLALGMGFLIAEWPLATRGHPEYLIGYS